MNDYKHQKRGLASIIAGMAAALGPSEIPSRLYLRGFGDRLKYRTGTLRVRKCNPSQHNTLRRDQVERRRKLKRRANRKAWGRYRRASSDI